MPSQLRFRKLPGLYAIVRLAPDASLPSWANRGYFSSITRTTDELSVVCPAGNVPAELKRPERWVCFRLEGPFAFSETGVLLSFIEPLSVNSVPIFAISTFDTDYVLVQQEFAATAKRLLVDAGHKSLPDAATTDRPV